MFTLQPITSLDAPELLPYRTMRRQLEHRQAGIFVAEGEKLVRRLLESRFEVVSVLLPPKWIERFGALLQSRPEHIAVYVAEKKLLETLTGFSMYQGLLAVGKVPAPITLPQLLRVGPRPLLLAAVDGLSSAENLGALVRNCAGFGAHGLLVGETCTSPFLRRAVRSSMGAIFILPILELNSLRETLRSLAAEGICCVAAHPHGDQELCHIDLRRDCCLVFGSEGYGLSPAVLQACQQAARVPMAEGVDSLNVGSAAAVFFYEASRQRSAQGHRSTQV